MFIIYCVRVSVIMWGWKVMTTNKKDKTEDIVEKVKDILEKKDEKKEGAR